MDRKTTTANCSIGVTLFKSNATTAVERRAAANSTYQKGGVSCFLDTIVKAESSVIRMNICGKSITLRVAAKRYLQAYKIPRKNESL